MKFKLIAVLVAMFGATLAGVPLASVARAQTIDCYRNNVADQASGETGPPERYVLSVQVTVFYDVCNYAGQTAPLDKWIVPVAVAGRWKIVQPVGGEDPTCAGWSSVAVHAKMYDDWGNEVDPGAFHVPCVTNVNVQVKRIDLVNRYRLFPDAGARPGDVDWPWFESHEWIVNTPPPQTDLVQTAGFMTP